MGRMCAQAVGPLSSGVTVGKHNRYVHPLLSPSLSLSLKFGSRLRATDMLYHSRRSQGSGRSLFVNTPHPTYDRIDNVDRRRQRRDVRRKYLWVRVLDSDTAYECRRYKPHRASSVVRNSRYSVSRSATANQRVLTLTVPW